jgi:hypothetical protein
MTAAIKRVLEKITLWATAMRIAMSRSWFGWRAASSSECCPEMSIVARRSIGIETWTRCVAVGTLHRVPSIVKRLAVSPNVETTNSLITTAKYEHIRLAIERKIQALSGS